MSALYQEEIAGCCRQLRLSSILAEYAMTTECDTNQEYLYQVLSRTIAYRRDCRIGKLIGSAGFPKPYDFSQFRADGRPCCPYASASACANPGSR